MKSEMISDDDSNYKISLIKIIKLQRVLRECCWKIRKRKKYFTCESDTLIYKLEEMNVSVITYQHFPKFDCLNVTLFIYSFIFILDLTKQILKNIPG